MTRTLHLARSGQHAASDFLGCRFDTKQSSTKFDIHVLTDTNQLLALMREVLENDLLYSMQISDVALYIRAAFESGNDLALLFDVCIAIIFYLKEPRVQCFLEQSCLLQHVLHLKTANSYEVISILLRYRLLDFSEIFPALSAAYQQDVFDARCRFYNQNYARFSDQQCKSFVADMLVHFSGKMTLDKLEFVYFYYNNGQMQYIVYHQVYIDRSLACVVCSNAQYIAFATSLIAEGIGLEETKLRIVGRFEQLVSQSPSVADAEVCRFISELLYRRALRYTELQRIYQALERSETYLYSDELTFLLHYLKLFVLEIMSQ